MRRSAARAATALGLTAAALALVPASPVGAGGGGCHTPGVTDAETKTVLLEQACFGPTVARIGVGDTLAFQNNDAMPHMVTGAGESFGGYDELLEGDVVEHTFAEAGVFPYYCLLHPSMVGAVVVGDAGASPAAASSSGSDETSGPGGNLAGVAAGAAAVVTVAGLAAARRRQTRSIVPSPGA